MKKIFLAAAIFTVSITQLSIAGDNMKSKPGEMGYMMPKMDTNGDSMVSKEEFMKAHEAMFDRIKGSNGMISLKDMAARHEKMKDHGSMKDHGHMGSGTK